MDWKPIDDFSIGDTVILDGRDCMVTDISRDVNRLTVCPIIGYNPDTCDGNAPVVVNPDDLHF